MIWGFYTCIQCVLIECIPILSPPNPPIFPIPSSFKFLVFLVYWVHTVQPTCVWVLSHLLGLHPWRKEPFLPQAVIVPPLGVVFHEPFSIYAGILDGCVLSRSLGRNPVSFKEPIALHALCSAEKHCIFQARSQNNCPQKDNPEWRAVPRLLLESCSGAWDILEEVSPSTSQYSFHLLPEHDKTPQCVCAWVHVVGEPKLFACSFLGLG